MIIPIQKKATTVSWKTKLFISVTVFLIFIMTENSISRTSVNSLTPKQKPRLLCGKTTKILLDGQKAVYLHTMRLIKRNMAQIIALCEKHKVLQLYVFGSALTRRFNKDSDVDFTVIFDREALPLMVYGDNYFSFKFALEDLLKRDVDLVEYNAVRNPYFKEELDETKQLIYGKAS